MDVFRSPIAVISYDEDNDRLIQRWYGFPKSEDFHEAIDCTVAFSKSHKVETVLSDTLHQDMLDEVDAEYAASIMPELVKNGLKAFAFLVSDKVYTQFAINHFSQQENTKLVKHFSIYSEAIRWLDEMSA